MQMMPDNYLCTKVVHGERNSGCKIGKSWFDITHYCNGVYLSVIKCEPEWVAGWLEIREGMCITIAAEKVFLESGGRSTDR